jgi:tRNA(Arg) A34 adenosine deaminase TadA
MCASAIRWAGFKEVIYGSSIRTIAESEHPYLRSVIMLANRKMVGTKYISPLL